MKAHCSSHGIEEAAASRVPPSGAVALSTLGGIALSRLLDALPVALEASTLGGQVIYANLAFEVATERPLSEIVRRPALWSLDDRVAAVATEAIRGGADWMGTVQVGGDRRLPVTLMPLRGADGSVNGCLCMVRASEPPALVERAAVGADQRVGVAASSMAVAPQGERAPGEDLRALAYDHAATMLLTTDAVGRVEHANPEWLARTGFTLGELVGRPIDSLLRASLAEMTGAAPWGSAPATDVPYRCQRRDGTSFEVLVTTSRSMVPAGSEGRRGPGGPCSLVHAVALHARAGAPSEVPPADTVRRLELLGRMAAGIAHDFNNMLGVITNYAELALRRSQPGEPVREAVLHIHEAAQRSARLTRQLLALGRGGTAASEVVDLNAAVTGLEGILRSTIGEVGNLRLELGGGPLTVKVPRAELEQVLVNLVANARDALRAGGLIAIRTRAESLAATAAASAGVLPDQLYVVLEVADSGCGMPQAVAARAFEPFFTTKGVHDGSGLGLAIIQGIVQQAGGVVSFRTTEAQGTTFEVRLPHRTSGSSAPPVPRLRRAIRILVVDDEAPVRRAVTRLVTGAGFHAVAAGDGAEALAALAREPIDLLLTDVVMPGMSGVALAELVAERHPRTAVVFMSGYAHDAIAERGLDPTKMPYLQKPFTRLELVRRVEHTLGLAVADEAH